MTIPLMVLAVLAIVGGWVGLPDGWLWGNAFVRFLAPAVGNLQPAIEANSAYLSLIALARAQQVGGSCLRGYCISSRRGFRILLA